MEDMAGVEDTFLFLFRSHMTHAKRISLGLRSLELLRQKPWTRNFYDMKVSGGFLDPH